MDTNLQKYFAYVKTVELGSFSKAAEALNYSQSGVSRMIADLEEECGLMLLKRDRAGVRLTSDGIALLPFARNLCEEYLRLREQVDELNGLQKGIIRIGTFASAAQNWLPGIIKRFHKDYPNIEYEILLGDFDEIETWINEGRIDFGFVELPTRDAFITKELEKDEFVAIIPKNHPFAGDEQPCFPIEKLEDEPFILLEKNGRVEIADFLKEHELKLNVRFTTWDDYTIMSMVEQGIGISILPRLILKRLPYDIVIKPLSKPTFRTIGIARKSGGTQSAALKRFIPYIDYRNQS